MASGNGLVQAVTDDLRTAWEQFKGEHADDLSRLGRLERAVDDLEVREQKARELGSDSPVRGTAPFLGLEQKAASHWRDVEPVDGADEVRIGALVAAMVAGQKVAKQLNDAEQKTVLNVLVAPQGGFAVPEAIGRIFIDSVRPQTRVLQAGARTYPMEAPVVHLPGWDDLISAAWRGEQGAFAEAAPTFRQVTLAAKSIATRVRISVELFEDAADNLAPIADLIGAEISRAIAEAIDSAALLGVGTDHQPLGLMNLDTAATGMNEVSMGVNGATPTDFDKFLDALYELEADSFAASAVLWHPRTPHTLSKIVTGISGDKTKLAAPERIAALPKLPTTQVPITQTQGSATDASTAFFGDWSQLVVGFRPDLGIRTQTDPYTEGANGIVNIYAFARADVAVLHGKAFCRLVGIKG